MGSNIVKNKTVILFIFFYPQKKLKAFYNLGLLQSRDHNIQNDRCK